MFTTDQLLAAANKQIDALRIDVPGSSRAGRYVTTRTFHYYRAQKLIDAPAVMRGTAGQYSERHLNQLLAIKTLQARWVPLPEIRTRLANANNEALQKIVAGDAGPTKRPINTKTEPKSVKPCTWVQITLHDEILLLVTPEYLQTATVPNLRALGQDLAAKLMAHQG